MLRDAVPAIDFHGARALRVGTRMADQAGFIIQHCHRHVADAKFTGEQQPNWTGPDDDDRAAIGILPGHQRSLMSPRPLAPTSGRRFNIASDPPARSCASISSGSNSTPMGFSAKASE